MAQNSRLLGFAKGAGLVVGGIAGVLSAGTAIGVAAEKMVVGRVRRSDDPHAGEAFGALPADRSYTVVADDGVPLHVEEVGDPDAPFVVVFVHGFALEMGSWYFQRRDLTDLGARLVFYDQRSHGRSGRAEASACTIDQLGADLHEVVRAAAGDRPVVLVGHSMGGMAVLGLADGEPRLFGEQVVGVALLNTSAGNILTSIRAGLPHNLTPRVLPLLARGAQASPRLVESARKVVADAVWLGVRRFSFGDPGTVGATLIDYVDRMIRAVPADVLGDFVPTLAGHDKVAALPALNRTTALVISGAVDRLTPPEHSELLAEAIPDAEYVVLPETGHLAMMEHPDAVDDALRRLVARVADRTGQARPARRTSRRRGA